MLRESRWVVASLIIGVGACGEPQTHAPTATVSDGSGARLHSITDADATPLGRAASCLSAEAADTLTLDPNAGIILPRGWIALANATNHEVVVLDSTWSIIARLGRRGSGPGEFQRVDWIGSGQGDTILAYDSSLRRITGFTADEGDAAWMADMPPAPIEHNVVTARVAGALGDSIIAIHGFQISPRVPGRHRTSVFVYLWNRRNGDVEYLATLRGEERQLEHLGSADLAILPALLPQSSFIAARKRRIVLSESDEFSFKSISIPDRNELTVAVEWPTTARVDDLITAELQALSISDPRVANVLRASAPDRAPATAQLLIDAADRVWVRHYPADESSNLWSVFASDGTPLATLRIPPTDVQDVGEAMLLGFTTSADGVRLPCLWRIDDERLAS